MKLDDKGFTLVELLVSMSIMGLLIIMAFPTIRTIQTNNTNSKFEEYGKAAVSAAKLYTDSYAEDLFDMNNNNGQTSIDFNELVKKGLLKDINISDSTCLNGSSVNVVKYKDDYTYCLNLVCTLKNSTNEVYRKVSNEGQCKNLQLFTVTYKYKSYEPHNVTVVVGNKHSVLTPGGAGYNPSANGENFKYWRVNEENKKPGDVIVVNSNLELEAITEPLVYKLKYVPSLTPDSGTAFEQECMVGDSCELKPNVFSKEYYTFQSYKYGDNNYQPGFDISSVIQPTSQNQTFYISVRFRENLFYLNYYSNGGSLAPGPNQICNVLAGCSPGQCRPVEQTERCKNKSGHVYQGIGSHGNLDATSAGLRDYNYSGSLYMTNGTCSHTNQYLIGGPTSSKKISPQQPYTEEQLLAVFEKTEELKHSDVSVDIYAEWDCPYSCAAGKYLPKNSTSCAKCPAGYYCPGGMFNFSPTSDQGKNKCSTNATGYDNSAEGSSKITQCYMSVSANHYIKTAKAASSTACNQFYHQVAHNVYYGSTSSCVENKFIVKYHPNGGSLAPSPYQRCMRIACTNFSTHALCKNCSSYGSSGSVNDGTTCIHYSLCDAEAGSVFVTKNALISNFKKDGVRNYSGYDGATIYMVRSGYKATGKWAVGSANASKKIGENDTFDTAEHYVVNGFGKSYWDSYKTGDVTVNLYAGWTK